MHAKALWIALGTIAVVGIGWYAFANRAEAPTETEQVATTTETTEEDGDGDPAFAIVTLTDSGFSPATITVDAGETVRFVNESSGGMWVGSDDHPTHTDYDGTSTREHCADGAANNGTFDQCAAVNQGEYWEYTFQRSGTFGFHNHMGASHTGTVIVR